MDQVGTTPVEYFDLAHKMVVGFVNYIDSEYSAIMSVDNIAEYLCGTEKTHRSISTRKAKEIVKNRHTIIGSRDYIYLFSKICKNYSIRYEGEDVDLDVTITLEYTLAEYMRSVNFNHLKGRSRKRVQTATYCSLKLLPYVMCTGGNKYEWYIYKEGIWTKVAYENLRHIISICYQDSYIEELGTDPTRLVTENDLSIITIVPNLKELIDKCDVFVCNTVTFDRKYLYIRSQLPSDLSTMKSNYNPADPTLYNSKIRNMLDIMVEWFEDMDTVEYHLDCIAMAASGRFTPRWANVLYGTGSDGKSTVLKIFADLFGSYAVAVPPTLYTKQQTNPDTPTPALLMTMNKLLVLVPDAGNSLMLNGYIFKQQTGSDITYARALFCEGSNLSSKPYILIATNEMQGPQELSILTRCRYTTMKFKRSSADVIQVLPEHISKGYKVGTEEYSTVFMREYGSVLMTEMLKRCKEILEGKRKIKISNKVRIDTDVWRKQNPVGKFCSEVLEELDKEDKKVIKEREKKLENRELTFAEIEHSHLQPTLFTLFKLWKGLNGISKADNHGINTLEKFTASVSLFEVIQELEVGREIVKYLPCKKIAYKTSSLAILGSMNPALQIFSYPTISTHERKQIEYITEDDDGVIRYDY